MYIDPKYTIKDLASGDVFCGRPPVGWRCTRGPHADGPCAAIRDERVSEKPTIIASPTYTGYTPCFGLYKEQSEIAAKWMDEHDKARHIPEGKTHRYSGAIGGAYTWSFTGTSLGQVVTVTCSCGEELDVSDYDSW